VYAVSAEHGVDDYVTHALRGLRPHAASLVVVAPSTLSAGDRARLAEIVDRVEVSDRPRYDHGFYAAAAVELSKSAEAFDEIVLTGDDWFGPITDPAGALARITTSPTSVWGMVENAQGLPESFPDQGFADRARPWVWTAAGSAVFQSDKWESYWSTIGSNTDDASAELRFFALFASYGFDVSYAFPAGDYPSADPALFTPDLLLADGFPFVKREIFDRYPPFLDRHAVLGRRNLAVIEGLGFPVDLVWQNLARTVPPKTLYANAGALEVLADVDTGYDRLRPFRVVAIVHVTDLDAAGELLDRLDNLPGPCDVVMTTADGQRAGRLERLVATRPGDRRVEIRVTPSTGGRDMSDFFVGCRDILLGGQYDLVVKVHARRMRDKTVNLRRYFRRYQYDNLLASKGYVASILALFQREPGLGIVFPPMMHIGYGSMGKGWSDLRDDAVRLCAELGISVPLDHVSPLAPFGGMWIARPEALLKLSERKWRYSEYGSAGRRRYRDLARLQERLVVSAAAERGYHARTVLTTEHASISHSALDFKVDQLFSTTRGYPVEQIQLLQRAGWTGYGGIVGLTRMYLRVNHPRAAASLSPLYSSAVHAFTALVAMRRVARRILRPGDPGEGTS
jgi:rhamnosyltransferase